MSTATSVQAQIVKKLIEGVLHTFDVQCKMKLSIGEPCYKSVENLQKIKQHSGEIKIGSSIKISSEQFNGRFYIYFSEGSFLKVVNRLLGEKYVSISSDNADAAAEFSNIIFGYAKKKLNDEGWNLAMARPEVDYPVVDYDKKAVSSVVLPFHYEDFAFHVEIEHDKIKKTA